MKSSYIIQIMFSFFISVTFIPVIIYLSKVFNFHDHVDERKTHNGNISRLGGLGIFLGFIIPFILLLIPIGDIARVMFIRWKDGDNIFIADKNHLHHRLQNLGFTNRGILFVLYGYTIILGLTSIHLLYIEPKYSLIFFSIIFLLALLTFYIFHHVEKIVEEKDQNK